MEPPAVPGAATVGQHALVQVAYSVDDVETAAARWSQRTGAGPFLVRHHGPASAVDARGDLSTFDHSSAYAQWGDVQLELVQVHPTTSASLRAAVVGGPGLHHVTWFAADLPAEQARLTALGWPAAMTARTASGSTYAFHDAREELGHLVEVYEPTPRVLSLYARVAAASRAWDGREPVRPLS